MQPQRLKEDSGKRIRKDPPTSTSDPPAARVVQRRRGNAGAASIFAECTPQTDISNIIDIGYQTPQLSQVCVMRVDPERDDEMATTDAPNAALPSAPARGSGSAVLCTEIVTGLQLSYDRVSAASRPTIS